MVHVGTWHLIGLVHGSNRCHVIASPNVDAKTAICGAGAITGHVSGWFDPVDPVACPRCSVSVAGVPPLTGANWMQPQDG